MKKLNTLLASICLASVAIPAQAELTITAPEVPAALSATIEAGNSYYLYNVVLGKFVNQNTSNNSYCGWSNTPYSFRLDNSTDGYFAFWQGNRYIGIDYPYSTYAYWSYSNSSSEQRVRFELQASSDDATYKIKYVYNNTFIGYNSSYSSYVYYNADALYRDWLLIPATCSEEEVESCCRYSARIKLYSILSEINESGYHTTVYENIYNDESKTASELVSLYRDLSNAIPQTAANSYLFPSWSDYKVLITDFGGFTRYNSSSNYMYRSRSENEAGFSTTVKTSTYVDAPSTMVLHIDCDQRWTNSPTMPIQIYVDGELYMDYQGETYYNYYYDSNVYSNIRNNYGWASYLPSGGDYSLNYSYSNESRNFFVDLEPGNHLVDIVMTKNYSSGYMYFYLRSIGIEKTPSLSVNLASAGTLGDEVLRAMANSSDFDYVNIQNVRKLKISGKMNDTDWETIHNMTSLFALDLSDAVITEIGKNQLSRHYHDNLNFLHDLKLPKTLTTIGQMAFYRSYIDCEIPETVTSIGQYAFANTLMTNAKMTNVKSIGDGAFYYCTVLKHIETSDSLSSLGGSAFAGCYNVDTLKLRGSIATIPDYCFDYGYNIKACSIPESVKTISRYAFWGNDNSQLNKLPDSLVSIGKCAFDYNYNATFSLPNTLKTIGEGGLRRCSRITGDLPSSITSFGNQAFYLAYTVSKIDTLHLPANASYGESVFAYSGVKNVVIDSYYTSLSAANLFANCSDLESVKIMSPTKLSVADSFVSGLNKDNLTIYVPDYLWTTYMLDSYWKNFIHVEPFDNAEIGEITIRENLVLNQNYRFNGTPNLAIVANVNLDIQGSAGMDLNRVTLWNNLQSNSYSQIKTATDQIYVFGDAVERLYTEGNKWYFISLPFDCVLSRTESENDAKYAIRYYDGAQRTNSIKIENTEENPYPESAHNYANNMTEQTAGNKQTFRYEGAQSLHIQFSSSTNVQNNYDYIKIKGTDGEVKSYTGTTLAGKVVSVDGDSFEIWITSNGSTTYYGYSIDAIYMNQSPNTSNWKNYDVANDIIPAGTGFIFMTSKNAWTRFYADNNPWKNKLFASSENAGNDIHIALQKNECVTSANRGWNLVGNPFPNYYNIHRINFSAPITLWTGTTYQAYSLHDDNIAIKPLQAMFVQCPEDADEIAFPAAGRQFSSVIQDQTNAPMNGFSVLDRQIIDLGISLDSLTDNTRVVLNEEASLGYETSCDASKFMSMDPNVPQMYSCGNDGENYAINERPVDKGVVQLGIYFPQSGTYSIHVSRNQAESVMLHDKQNDMMFNLADDDYEFHAEAGTDNCRFELIVERRFETSIEEIAEDKTFDMNASAVYYDMNGRYAGCDASELNPGVYMTRQNGKVQKVTVRQ